MIINQDFRIHQETAKNKSGRERRMYSVWGKKNAVPPLRTGRGLDLRSRPTGLGGGAVGMILREAGRGRKVPPHGRTLGLAGTWAQEKYGKRGKSDGGRHAQSRARKSFGLPGRGGKRSRAVADGRRGRRPGGQLLCDRVIWGEISGCKDRGKRRQRVKDR